MRFSFHRGSLALDFVGTVGARASVAPEERLPDVDALAVWLAEADLMHDAEPTGADLSAARKLREAVFQLGTAIVNMRALSRLALATLNEAAEGVRSGAPILDASRRVRWVSDAPFRLALGRVAYDAIRSFTTEPERLTVCEQADCGALLLSRSRSDRRRWCSMEACGNRAKVAAYRARQATRSARGSSRTRPSVLGAKPR